jgi:hypothetical protein
MDLYLLAFLLACGSWLVWPRILNRSAFNLLLLAIAVHTFGLISRMYLQERPPVTNLYSSAIFIGWGICLLGLIHYSMQSKLEQWEPTIADGISVRVPVPEALTAMRSTVDEVMLVSDAEILAAMRMLFSDAGLVVEPAGAAGIAAIAKRRNDFAGQRVASPICGGNLTQDQVRRWLL